MKKGIISAILGTLITSTVLAETSGYYTGVSYLSAENGMAGQSEYGSGYEILVGYKINSLFAVEANYLDLGSFDFNSSNTEYSIDSDAFSISALYTYPIDDFNLIGKLGYLFGNEDVSTIPEVDHLSDVSINSLVLGAGLSYKLNKTIEIKTEFNITSYTNHGVIGINYYF